MSLSALKRNRKSFLSDLVKQSEKLDTKSSYKDDRFWKPTKDDAGNAYAEIRFLPQPDGDPSPFVQYHDHFFKGPTGQYYIENSLTTFKQPDPVSELNNYLWNLSEDKNSPGKKQARDQKRKLHHVSNIYVISDPAKPENNGKVFLFDYGKKIYDKIAQSIKPVASQYEEAPQPVNPFDLWEGANFIIRCRIVEKWPNYDRSEFKPPSQLDEDEVMDKIYEQVHPLNEFIDPSNYKSYDELKTRLNLVMGTNDNPVVRESMTSSPPPSMPSTKPADDLDQDEIPFSGNEDAGESSNEDITDYFNKLLDDD